MINLDHVGATCDTMVQDILLHIASTELDDCLLTSFYEHDAHDGAKGKIRTHWV